MSSIHAMKVLQLLQSSKYLNVTWTECVSVWNSNISESFPGFVLSFFCSSFRLHLFVWWQKSEKTMKYKEKTLTCIALKAFKFRMKKLKRIYGALLVRDFSKYYQWHMYHVSCYHEHDFNALVLAAWCMNKLEMHMRLLTIQSIYYYIT